MQPVSLIRQRILGVAGTYVVLNFLSHATSKEYSCVTLHCFSIIVPPDSIHISVKLIRGSNDLGIHRSTTPLQSNIGSSQFMLQVRCKCRLWLLLFLFLMIRRCRWLRALQTIALRNLTILLLTNHRCRRSLGQHLFHTTVKRPCSPSETPIALVKS